MNTFRKNLGDEGEQMAREFLIKQNFAILDTNVKTRYGEIDLIAKKGNHLYFVEIRRRTGNQYGSALESISQEKIRRIRLSAEVLLLKNKNWQHCVPFLSVIAIDQDETGQNHLEFLPNAITD